MRPAAVLLLVVAMASTPARTITAQTITGGEFHGCVVVADKITGNVTLNCEAQEPCLGPFAPDGDPHGSVDRLEHGEYRDIRCDAGNTVRVHCSNGKFQASGDCAAGR